MMKLTKQTMTRGRVNENFGLEGYENVLETVIQMIKSEDMLKFTDVKTAIELCMIDFEVENSAFYDILKPYYNENYDLIPIVGIDGAMDISLLHYLTDKMLEDDTVLTVGRILAFDHMTKMAKDKVEYTTDIIDFINTLIPTSYIDIQEMYDDIEVGLEISEITPAPKKGKCDGCTNCTCDTKKKKPSAPQIKVVVLDDDKIADDILALLKLFNGGK